MGRRDTARTRTFVERFAAEMVDAGMPRMPARAFAVLLTRDTGAATAAELAESLEASAGSVSGAVRYLIQVGLVARERRPGERFDRYRLHNDVWYEAVYNREPQVQRWADLTRSGAAAVGPASPAGQRLQETADFFEFVRDEMPELLRRWRRRRASGVSVGRSTGNHGGG
jgi:DNA-binding transcriptional regulator GbsR (MarR family)